MRALIIFIIGALFGLGLTISQMVNPNKVLSFLDITGSWDASLVFVMLGALVVFWLGYKLVILSSPKPYFADKFDISTKKNIDSKLIFGAAIFGVGWGLVGICPGPAIANILGLNLKIFVFIVAMIIGMKMVAKLQQD